MEYGNPNLGILGALSPAENTGQTMGGETPRQPVFNPRTQQWVDPITGKPADPPTPEPQSLLSMWRG